ncbi:hypothetical protein B0I08_10646 [Glaciihabitans tibetensis]|uniref:Uncharacterized protein n=1 Tax=Glaciihabitans tibetensis TaxID=1266600 RepID=A0A2T0VB67_9MICO|nr:hypothetical protein B0I08_10646 [Glaciihabitans tibetensis]
MNRKWSRLIVSAALIGLIVVVAIVTLTGNR